MALKGSKVIHWNKKELKIVKNFKVSSIIKNNLLPGRTVGSIRSIRTRLKEEGAKIYNRTYIPSGPLLLLKNNIRGTSSYKGTIKFYTPEEDAIILKETNKEAAKLTNRTIGAISVRRSVIKRGENNYKFVNKPKKETNNNNTSSSVRDLNFVISGVDVVISSNMTKKVLITKDRIEILNK